jgi:hypothetical protein
MGRDGHAMLGIVHQGKNMIECRFFELNDTGNGRGYFGEFFLPSMPHTGDRFIFDRESVHVVVNIDPLFNDQSRMINVSVWCRREPGDFLSDTQ